MKQLYADFGATDLSQDPYVRSLAAAYDDGRACAKEGRPLNMRHIGSGLRSSYSRGFREAELPHPLDR